VVADALLAAVVDELRDDESLDVMLALVKLSNPNG
jgi:hypothetical protein